MDFLIVALIIWYIIWPENFGQHLGRMLNARELKHKIDVDLSNANINIKADNHA